MKTTVTIKVGTNMYPSRFWGWRFKYEADGRGLADSGPASVDHTPRSLLAICMGMMPGTEFGISNSISFLPSNYKGQEDKDPIPFGKVVFPVRFEGASASLHNDDVELGFSLDHSDFKHAHAEGDYLKFVWCSVIASRAILYLLKRDEVTARLHAKYPSAIAGIGVSNLKWGLYDVVGNAKVPAEDALLFWEESLRIMGKEHWK